MFIMEVFMNNKYMRALLLVNIVIPAPTWCKIDFKLSREHIEQVKRQLTYEESRLAKLQAAALIAAGAGVGGLSYLGYKWLKASPASQAQPAQVAQQAHQNQAGIKSWLLDQALDIWQIGGRTVKGVIAYEIYSGICNKINDLYAERTLVWFLQRRTVWYTALDNFKQEVVNYNPQDQDSKDQLENACRCLLAELEALIGFMQYTAERAQAQLQSQPRALSVSMFYLTRLGMSSERIKAIAARLIEHVKLLLDYDQDYDQKRSLHNTVMGSLIDNLTNEITLFKQFEQKVRTLNSGVAA
jgi:hypothetical protein